MCWWDVRSLCPIIMWNWPDILEIWSDNVRLPTVISSTGKGYSSYDHFEVLSHGSELFFLLYRHDTHLLCLYAPPNLWSQQWMQEWGVFLRDNILLKVLKLCGQWKTILLWQGSQLFWKRLLFGSQFSHFIMLPPLQYLSTYSWKLKHSSLCFMLLCF